MTHTLVEMESICNICNDDEYSVLHRVNGKKFSIDDITDIRPASNPKSNFTNEMGLLFTCMIMGEERYLWFREGKWFLESSQ